MKYLDTRAMRLALRGGVHRVVAGQEALNRINVFPVADGDTGTNLALTMGALRGVITDDRDVPLHRLLAQAADAILDGARGNSGAIMAQFFQGLSDAAGELSRFTVYTFSKAVRQGSDYARDALSEPREGTILSVINAFADHLGSQVKNEPVPEFPALLGSGVETARSALAATTDQLDALRRAGVVDAGAKGFVAMLEGMLDYVRDGREVPVEELPLDETSAADMAGEDEDLEYRFCTECMISGREIDRRKLRERLSALGGSLVLAGSRHKARVHIHVNDPEQVFELAREYGTVSAEKADDMQRQQHTTHSGRHNVAIITDSAADLTEEDMERLDIHMVPLRVQFGESGYLDKLSINQQEFFEELATNPHHPTTSQPSPGDFRRQFQFLANHFDDVLAISLTGAVSGTHAAARAAAERVEANGELHVVDSRNISLGQGLIVRHAAECAQAGMDADAILAELDRVIGRTQTFGLVADLRYAVRGGRVPPSRRFIAEALNLNPVLRSTPEGNVTSGGIIFGRGNRLPKFARYIARRAAGDGPLRVGVGHAACEGDALELERLLREALPTMVDSYVTDICSALGVHGGPGTLVAAVMQSAPCAAVTD